MSQNDLVMKIGELIISDSAVRAASWDALSFVATIQPGHLQRTGYRFLATEWEGLQLEEYSLELFDSLQELQDAMAAETGNRWKQALIHITRPGPEIDIQFEYDDPTRWSLKKVSLDLADYAESLRPPVQTSN